MKEISRDIQSTFEELMKLLLRKALPPVLNQLSPNSKVVYNAFKKKYERGFVGSSPDDTINKYSYVMTHDCLGWVDDSITTFKTLAKFIKNNTPQRFPASHARIRNASLETTPIAFSGKDTRFCELKSHLTPGQYKNFLLFLTSNNMHSVITNRRASFSYISDVPYSQAFKQLESIGKDIIDQTDSSIDANDTAKMSTAMLRVKLFSLDKSLGDFAVNYPSVFAAYIEALHIINSVPRSKMNWIINLIALLSFQSWDKLDNKQQQCYINALGENFIIPFNDNELITILLQSGSSELILTTSYLYSLLKMLFSVFGYSKITPIISDLCSDSFKVADQEKMRRHYEKYRGATFRRGDDRNVTCMSETSPKKDHTKPEPEPVDPYIYEFIKLFGDLYPTLIGLMGGTETFPPENIEIDCNTVPANYHSLDSLPDFLWRFNDFSYCRYIECVSSRQLHNALSSKVNAKVKYLQTK